MLLTESPKIEVDRSKFVIGLKIFRIEDRELSSLTGMRHGQVENQPLFLLSNQKNYGLDFDITFYGAMESLVKRVKNISVKLRNFKEYELESQSGTTIMNGRRLKARAYLDSGKKEIQHLISFKDGVDDDIKVLDINVYIEGNEQRTFIVGMRAHYTTNANIMGNTVFRRDVSNDCRTTPHRHQDLKTSVLFCGLSFN